MKTMLIVLFAVAAVGLAGFSLHEHSQLVQLRAQLADAEGKLLSAQEQLKETAEAADKIARAEGKAKLLQDTLTESSAAAAKQSAQVEQLQSSLAAAKTNSDMSGLAGMFKDPEMRKMIKEQQKMVLGPMIEKMYADLFQQLQLTPEQAAQVKDLLQKKMLAGADIGMSLLDGSLDATKRKELTDQIKTETDNLNAQIKDLLGEDKYKDLQAYEKTAGDRMVVGQFRDQLAGSASALSTDQEKQLIQLMQDQNSSFKWTTSPSKYQNPDGETDFSTLFSEERINKLVEEKTQFDQQVLDRAAQVLNGDQLKQFEQFQKTQRQIQIAGMKMAAKMFGGKSP